MPLAATGTHQRFRLKRLALTKISRQVLYVRFDVHRSNMCLSRTIPVPFFSVSFPAILATSVRLSPDTMVIEPRSLSTQLISLVWAPTRRSCPPSRWCDAVSQLDGCIGRGPSAADKTWVKKKKLWSQRKQRFQAKEDLKVSGGMEMKGKRSKTAVPKEKLWSDLGIEVTSLPAPHFVRGTSGFPACLPD